MKRKIISILLALSIFGVSVQAYSILLEFDIGTQTAKLNGEVIDAPSYLSERGNTMVGLRAVAQILGVIVEWNQEAREVILRDDGLEMKVFIDSDIAVINGTSITMTEPAVLYNDRTMVPIRFISEGFGAYVLYMEETNSVLVAAETFYERCEQLQEASRSLVYQYPQALQSWISDTDKVVSSGDFVRIWDSMVNTKIMELLPGRIITEEICEKYRTAAKVTFDDQFILTSTGIGKNETFKIFVKGGYDTVYVHIMCYPSTRSIEAVKMPSEFSGNSSTSMGGSGSVGTIAGSSSIGSIGGSSGGGGSATGSLAAPQTTMSPEALPETTPKPQAIMPPYTPSDNMDHTDHYGTSDYESPEPTPQITEGPEGKDNHFNDMIDGL